MTQQLLLLNLSWSASVPSSSSYNSNNYTTSADDGGQGMAAMDSEPTSAFSYDPSIAVNTTTATADIFTLFSLALSQPSLSMCVPIRTTRIKEGLPVPTTAAVTEQDICLRCEILHTLLLCFKSFTSTAPSSSTPSPILTYIIDRWQASSLPSVLCPFIVYTLQPPPPPSVSSEPLWAGDAPVIPTVCCYPHDATIQAVACLCEYLKASQVYSSTRVDKHGQDLLLSVRLNLSYCVVSIYVYLYVYEYIDTAHLSSSA